jgi:hypothetical protein
MYGFYLLCGRSSRAGSDVLEVERQEIEAEFGESLQWTRRDDVSMSRIYAARPGEIMKAAGEGFEPSGRLRAQRFSRPPRSTAPAPRLR